MHEYHDGSHRSSQSTQALAKMPGFCNSVASSALPSGGALVRWDVDLRRFTGRDATVVSPAFVLELPAFGAHSFKVLVHAAAPRGARAGTGFRSAKAHGRIELKCESRSGGSGPEIPEGQTYVVSMHKTPHDRLGLDLASQDGEPWRIKSISAGLVGRWNASNAGAQVLPGDRILEANGVRGSADRVRDECSRNGPLRLVMRRGPQTSPSFRISFGVGCGAEASAPALRGPVLHSFARQSCCGLRRDEEDFDLMAALGAGSRRLAFHVEVLPACE